MKNALSQEMGFRASMTRSLGTLKVMSLSSSCVVPGKSMAGYCLVKLMSLAG